MEIHKQSMSCTSVSPAKLLLLMLLLFLQSVCVLVSLPVWHKFAATRKRYRRSRKRERERFSMPNTRNLKNIVVHPSKRWWSTTNHTTHEDMHTCGKASSRRCVSHSFSLCLCRVCVRVCVCVRAATEIRKGRAKTAGIQVDEDPQ